MKIEWWKQDGAVQRSKEPVGYTIALVPNLELRHLHCTFNDKGSPVVIGQARDLPFHSATLKSKARDLRALCETHAEGHFSGK